MPTIAEQWIEEGRKEGREEGRKETEAEGRREGLLMSIEIGLECGFGKDGLMLLPEIRKIHDAQVLYAILKKLWTADNADDVREIYQDV